MQKMNQAGCEDYHPLLMLKPRVLLVTHIFPFGNGAAH